MNQSSLFDPPDITINYHSGNQESLEAHAVIKESASTLRKNVLEFIRAQGEIGATCREVEIALNMKHQTASARITELKKAEEIKPSGEKRLTESGCRAAVMIVA